MGCLAVVEASHKDSQFKQLQVAGDVGGLNNLDIYKQTSICIWDKDILPFRRRMAVATWKRNLWKVLDGSPKIQPRYLPGDQTILNENHEYQIDYHCYHDGSPKIQLKYLLGDQTILTSCV